MHSVVHDRTALKVALGVVLLIAVVAAGRPAEAETYITDPGDLGCSYRVQSYLSVGISYSNTWDYNGCAYPDNGENYVQVAQSYYQPGVGWLETSPIQGDFGYADTDIGSTPVFGLHRLYWIETTGIGWSNPRDVTEAD